MTQLASPLVQNRFKISFSRLPNISFYAQRLNLPGIQLDAINVGTPFSYMREPGDKLLFDKLTMDFKLDENLDCYFEIFNWMNALGFPESFEQYEQVGREDTFGNATVHIGNNNGLKGVKATYYNLFPVALTNIQLDATIQQPQFIDCQVQFSFDYYRLERPSVS